MFASSIKCEMKDFTSWSCSDGNERHDARAELLFRYQTCCWFDVLFAVPGLRTKMAGLGLVLNFDKADIEAQFDLLLSHHL